MFKKLFLVWFLVQTLASSAWGAVGVPAFTPSEQLEMKVMHQVMHMDAMKMTGMNKVSDNMVQCVDDQKTMSCDQCNMTNCHSLLCASIHVVPVFNLAASFKLELLQAQANTNVSFAEPITTISIQPELPPPSTTSI